MLLQAAFMLVDGTASFQNAECLMAQLQAADLWQDRDMSVVQSLQQAGVDAGGAVQMLKLGWHGWSSKQSHRAGFGKLLCLPYACQTQMDHRQMARHRQCWVQCYTQVSLMAHIGIGRFQLWLKTIA